jgi:hypothetical protein
MAGLRDYNGKIVIDDGEAAADVRRIETAGAKIEEAIKLLDPGKIDDARMFGAARTALDGVLEKMRGDLEKMRENCGHTKDFINNTVEKYRRIDRELRDTMKGA